MRFLITALLLFATANYSFADDASTARDRAKAHYEEGEKAFRLGEFQRAVTEFKASYEESAVPLLLYNIAQAYRQLGESRQALFFYKQFLASAGAAGDSRRLAEQRVAELTKALEDTSKAREAPPTGTVSIEHHPVELPVTPAAGAAVDLKTSIEPKKRSLVRKPWFWAALGGGAAVAVVAITLGVVLGGRTRNPTAVDGQVSGN